MGRIRMALGLALLYASAYFLPFLKPYSLYFTPSFFHYIVLPSLVSVIVLTPLSILCGSSIVSPGFKRGIVYVGTTSLTFIAAKSMFDAAGYPWVNLAAQIAIPLNAGTAPDVRLARAVLVGVGAIAALLLVHLNRHRMSKLVKFYSALGYSFLFLAIYRCVVGDMAMHAAGQAERPPIAGALTSPELPRRVVWVIFDEMDYGLAFGANRDAATRLPNFDRLASYAVDATEAYTPGRDTLYSIPALLTGTALSGVAFDHRNMLNLIDQHGKTHAFTATNSLFARLPGGVGSASVLGFYHPYCKVFPDLQSCHSTYLGNAGRWFDSLTFFSEAVFSASRHSNWAMQYLPEWLLFEFDPMFRATSELLSRLDGTLENQRSSLDFIHLNLPHLPNAYVQRLMRAPIKNETEAYRQNLVGADMVLGRIVHELEAKTKEQNILLIVSSDHWLRTHSQHPASVPFFAWNVGTHSGQRLSQPVSTVHTSQLVLDFLDGKINSQPEIALSLGQRPLFPSWISPDGYKY
jgi:hypothetical protein